MLSRHTRTTRTEKRYRSFIAATAQIVWATDAQGNVVEDIPSWRAFTGQTREEIKGQGWLNALHPEDREPTATVWAHAIQTCSHYAAEYRVRRHDGEYCHFMVRGIPLFNEDGGVREWVGTCTDITLIVRQQARAAMLRKEQNVRLHMEIAKCEQIEESLRERRLELGEAQRLARVGSWVWELQPERVSWSEEMFDIFGHDPALPAPTYPEAPRFFTRESWERVDVAVKRTLETGASFQLDLEIIRADGRRAFITSRGEARRDAAGRIVRLRGTVQDITERKQAEEELQWQSALFEALVHGSFDGILVVDSQGKKILQNQRVVELWEIPQDIATDPDDKKQVQFVIKERVKLPEQFLAKVAHLYSHPNEISRDEVELKTGTVLDRYSSPVIDSNGKYYGRIWSFRDITERKRAEEALKKAHDTLEQRVQARTAELKITNEQLGRTNRLLHILSECDHQMVHARCESELLREICRIIVGPGGYPSVWIGFAEEDDAKTVRPVAQHGFEEGFLQTLKITWTDAPLGRGPAGTAIRSGEPCIVKNIRTSINFAPWREEATRRGFASAIGLPLRSDDRVFGALTIYSRTVDAFPTGEVAALTELADDLAYGIISLRAREEIQRLNRDLENRVAARTAELLAANQELETFNYSVSHDLQAPLRAVDGFSRFLKREHSAQLDSEANDCVDRICGATARMDQLLKGLLNLAKVGRTALRTCPLNLSALAAEVAAELRESEPQRVVEFTIAPDLRAEGDPDLLRSVLQNLIGNAWKYTSKRDRANIEFGCEQVGGERVFHVRDDGAGFNPAYADKLFKAFQRLHRQEEFPGTGIGLIISQRILQRHGGRIWAEGANDKGATFYFTIPSPK